MVGDGARPPRGALLTEGGALVRLASQATLPGPGRAELDPEGCARLVVETHPWHCTVSRFCLPSSDFLSLKEVGCGEPREVAKLAYTGGLVRAEVDGLEVRAHVESISEGGQTDVLRVRVGWRAVSTP